MDLMRFISAGAAKAAPMISARSQREEAQRAEHHYKLAEYIRSQWLESLLDDGLRIGYGQPDCSSTMVNARTALLFVMHALELQKTDAATLHSVINTALACQDAMQDGNPPHSTRLAIAAGISDARDCLRNFPPIQIIEASFAFEKRYPKIVAQGRAAEAHERAQAFLQKAMPAPRPNHVLTFGQAERNRVI